MEHFRERGLKPNHICFYAKEVWEFISYAWYESDQYYISIRKPGQSETTIKVSVNDVSSVPDIIKQIGYGGFDVNAFNALSNFTFGENHAS